MRSTYRRRAGLVALAIPALGLTPAWALDGARFQAGGASTISDPAGDTTDDDDKPVAGPPADVVSASAEQAGGSLVLRYTAADGSDPRGNPNWASDDSFTDFMLDANGDGKDDFDVEYGLDEGTFYAEVYKVDGSDDPPFLCDGTATFEAGVHTVSVPLECLGGAPAYGYRVETSYDLDPAKADSNSAYDLAPDSGFAGPA